jgi:hypothetical protein
LCDADTGTCDVEQVGRFDPPNRSEWNALGIESLSNSTQHQQISYEAALQVCLDLAPTAVRVEMMGFIESPCLGKRMHSDSIPGDRGRVRVRVEMIWKI